MKHSLTGDSPSVPARASQWTRVVASARGSHREGPPGRSPGGQKEPNRWALAFDRVAALRVVGLGRRDRQAHLLAQCAGKKPTNRVCLPARGFHEFLQGGASRTLQQVEDSSPGCPACPTWPWAAQRGPAVPRTAAFWRPLAARPGHRPPCWRSLLEYRSELFLLGR